MKASHASYRFFAHLYNGMFGDIITGKYTERGFDERRSFEGGNEVHHFYTDEAGVTQSNYSVDPTSPVFHVDEYFADELGISQQDMIAAFTEYRKVRFCGSLPGTVERLLNLLL